MSGQHIKLKNTAHSEPLQAVYLARANFLLRTKTELARRNTWRSPAAELPNTRLV